MGVPPDRTCGTHAGADFKLRRDFHADEPVGLGVQWSDDGRIYEGLDSRFVAQLPAPVWAALAKERATLALDGSYGVLICDNMRLRWHQPETHSRIAPDSMPASTAEWLGKLAIALQDADRPQLSAAMRAALDQFGSR